MSEVERPLEGLRVIEMGQLLAGPFAGTILAYFGAEVIKVEPPGGDPVRGWRLLRDGTSLWYASLGRNKKSVTLDLKSKRGRELALQLIDTADVVVENFRPGLMESCAVQMLLVALSRRICCSLVWSAIRSPGLPAASLDTPIILPGILRLYCSLVAKKAACGPPYPIGTPNL